MQLKAITGDIIKMAADAVVLPVFQGEEVKGPVDALDKHFAGKLSRTIKEEAYRAEPGKTLTFHTFDMLPGKRLILVGMGERSKVTNDGFRRASATALKIVKSVKANTVVFPLPGKHFGSDLDPREIAYASASGALLADYEFFKYKKKHEEARRSKVDEWTFMVTSDAQAREMMGELQRAAEYVEGVSLARDLINEPGMYATPKRLVQEAEKIAKGNPRIALVVYDKRDLIKMGAQALLAVSRGSEEPPYLIHLTYRPPRTVKKRLALVGKGLTFDSGGLSIKAQEGMKNMKIDMAGAATVLGVFSVLVNRELEHEVHGVIPATENLISGKAIKPGDVVTAMNGKTIEIVNTDAEGRVILADAISYITGKKGKLDALIDFATLTGACIVALGEQIAGLFSTDGKLKDAMLASGRLEGEQFWELPLPQDYEKLLESQIADIANIGSNQWAGAITAALFLKQFVPFQIPWLHLDMAGPAWEERGEIPYIPKGGTGFAVRSTLRFLEQFS